MDANQHWRPPSEEEARREAHWRFSVEEQKGNWKHWNGEGYPPWWIAGCEWVWTVVEAYGHRLAVEEKIFDHTFRLRMSDHIAFQAGALWDEKLCTCEHYRRSPLAEAREEFIRFTLRELTERLAAFDQEVLICTADDPGQQGRFNIDRRLDIIDSELASRIGVPVTGAEASPDETSAVSQAASHPEETEPAPQETTQGIELNRPEAGSRTVAPVLDAGSEGPSSVVAGGNAPAAAPAEGEPSTGARHDELVARVKRNFGCDGKPPFARFYKALHVTNSEFAAWERNDAKRCGKSKWRSLDKAAAALSQ